MNCWEILGIQPTQDRQTIDRAYEQQKKFASGEELERLQQAYREASGQKAPESASDLADSESTTDDAAPEAVASEQPRAELSAEEQQIVREVVIQIRALLNDSRRSAEEGIWRAILTEPPADRREVRAAIAESLEHQIRPMADNGSFPAPVVGFLGDWFGWSELQTQATSGVSQQESPEQYSTREVAQEDSSQEPTTNFWPAVVGWIVAIAVLAAFFEGIFGG